MKKVMNVELRINREQTETQGFFSQRQRWSIDFESLDDPMGTTAIEQAMRDAVYKAFPASFKESIEHILYGDLSHGGSVIFDDTTLTVGFAKKQDKPVQ